MNQYGWLHGVSPTDEIVWIDPLLLFFEHHYLLGDFFSFVGRCCDSPALLDPPPLDSFHSNDVKDRG